MYIYKTQEKYPPHTHTRTHARAHTHTHTHTHTHIHVDLRAQFTLIQFFQEIKASVLACD